MNSELLKNLPDHIKALYRPLNFADLSVSERWQIDKDLGILDWDGNTEGLVPDFEVWVKYKGDGEEYASRLPDWYPEYFEEISEDNPKMEGVSWYEYIRPLQIHENELRDLNGVPHFLYGFDESLFQSDDCPQFILEEENLEITVEWRLK